MADKTEAQNDVPATAQEQAVQEVVDVFFDDAQDGVTGTKLADEGRPLLFKLDHKKGFYFPTDDDTERHQEITGVIVAARTYYRRFGSAGPCCESDNGQEGYDSDLKQKIKCRSTGQDAQGVPTYDCKFSFEIKNFSGNGQCGLGLQLQLVAMLDDVPTPMQINMSSSSARAFASYLNKLKRKKLSVRGVTTKLSSRYVKGSANPYYCGKFDIEDETPCVDISGLIAPAPTKEPLAV